MSQGSLPHSAAGPHFPYSFFSAFIPAEVLVALCIPHQIQLQLGFPNSIPASFEKVFIFFLGYLSLLQPLICFLFIVHFCQEQFVHHRSSCHFWITSFSKGLSSHELEGDDPWQSTDSSFLTLLSKAVSSVILLSSPKSVLKSRIVVLLFALFSQDPKLHHSMATATKSAPVFISQPVIPCL